MKDHTEGAHISLADRLGIKNAVYFHVDIPRVNNMTIGVFRDQFKEFNPEEGKTLVVDMEAIDFMNTAGLAQLVKAQKEFTSHGGKVVLLDVKDRQKETLELTGLLEIFEIHSSK